MPDGSSARAVTEYRLPSAPVMRDLT